MRLGWAGWMASALLLSAATPAPRVDLNDAWFSLHPPLRIYGLADGLPNPSVYTVARDRAGRLWVGTQDGTAHCNGQVWSTLGLPSESTSNFVRSILETKDGSHWFGTENGGLWQLKQGSWTQWKIGQGFASNIVNSLLEVEEPGGGVSLWASTRGGGVGRFDGTAWHFFDTRDGLPSNDVWRLRQLDNPDGSRTLWAITTKGISRLEGTSWKMMKAKDGWPEGEVNDIAQTNGPDGKRYFWMAKWGEGLYRWDGARWDLFEPKNGFPSIYPIMLCVTPGPDGQQVLWASSYDRGLAYYTDERWRGLNTSTGLPANGIYTLLGSDGTKPTLWMGTRGGGLASLDLSGWYVVDRQSGLPSDEVNAFLESQDARGQNRFWIGTSRGLVRWEEGAWHLDDERSGLPQSHICSLLATHGQGGETTIWAGTLKGLAKREGARWKHIPTPGLVDQRILCLAEQKDTKGQSIIWGGGASGLIRLEGNQQTLLTKRDGLPGTQVFGLKVTRDQDGADTLWVGTRGDGIGRLRRGKWTVYGSKEGVTNPSVYCFHESRGRDGRRWLWAGTFGGGALRLALDGPDTQTWESFDVKKYPDIPSNVVVRIEEDFQGRIYLVTQRGVARLSFDDSTNASRPSKVENYGTGDGLPPVSCSYGASWVDHAGRIWVATHKGAAALDTSRELLSPPPPNLVLDRVLVPGRAESIPKNAVLGYKENQLTFEFGLPLFHRPQDVRFRTQLLGIEDSPSPWGALGRRELTALPHGKYVLRIEAKDHLGRASNPLEFPFRIKPAPWVSPLAYVFYTLALGGLFVWFYRIRIRLLRQRTLELENTVAEATSELEARAGALVRLNEEKNQFMGIAAHDLKNPLNAVLLAGELIQGGDLEESDLKKYSSMIVKATRQMAELVRNMLDVNRMDTGRMELDLQAVDLAKLAGEVERDYWGRATAKSIHLELSGKGPCIVVADPVHTQGILENFVSNAVKFTRPDPAGSHIWLRYGTTEDTGWIEVQDEGPGFTEEDKQKAFQRFTPLSAKPTAGEGSSGLGLSIVKSLATAMGGRVELISEVGKGATLRLHLPRLKPMP